MVLNKVRGCTGNVSFYPSAIVDDEVAKDA